MRETGPVGIILARWKQEKEGASCFNEFIILRGFCVEFLLVWRVQSEMEGDVHLSKRCMMISHPAVEHGTYSTGIALNVKHTN